MCKKNTAYYIQLLKKFTGELQDIATLIGELGDKAAPIINFMSVYGFTFETDEEGTLHIGTPKIHSVWGIRAYSKKLITLQDLRNFLENHGELDEWSEDELWDVVGIIAQNMDYPNHVHQSAEVIGNAVSVYQYVNGDDEDDEETGGEDGSEQQEEQDPCGNCPKVHVIKVVIG